MRRTTSGKFGGACVAALMVGTALAGSGMTNVAFAQQASTAQQKTFQIKAQSLAGALTQFGQQSGMQVSVDAAAVRGLSSPGVSGALTITDAAARLLAGSGLSYRVEGGTLVISDRVSDAHGVPATNGALVLDVINVTGGGNTADLPFETPGSASHISAEQISRTPPTSVGDMFRSTPGVMAAGNRVGASVDVNIRGLQGQNRVNVMVDGTRQTNNSYRGYRGSRNETYVDPDFIGGIDVSKGPSGGAGGVGAMGGVVNMRTITARDIVTDGQVYGARIKTGLGSNTMDPLAAGSTKLRGDGPEFFNGDAWSGSVAAGVVQDNYEFVAAFSKRKAGNYFAGTKGKATYLNDSMSFKPPFVMPLSPFGPGKEVANTSQDVTSFLTKGKLSWGDGHSLTLGYIHYQNDYGENLETDIDYLYWVPTQNKLSNTRTNTFTSTYKYSPEDGGYIDFTSNLWFSDVRSQSGVAGKLTWNPLSDGKNTATTYGGDASNVSIVDSAIGQFTIKNGVEFVHEKAREKQLFWNPGDPENPMPVGNNPNGNRLMLSGFNETKLEVNDWLTFAGGLRYDYYEATGKGIAISRYPDKDGARLNPQASVTVTPFDGVQLFGSYVEGWRPPSLRETSSPLPGVVPNPDLKPEVSKNFEFGINVMRDDVLTSGDSLRLKAVWFDNNYDDYILRGRTRSGSYTWTNIEQAEFQGYELSVGYDAGVAYVEGALTSYADINFCNRGVCNGAVGVDDYGVVTIPPKYSGTVTAGVRLFEERLSLGGRVYFFGERFGRTTIGKGGTNSATYWPGAAIVDLFGSYKINDNANLDFSVENIADRYYLDPIATSAVPAPGRTFRASLTAKW